MGVILWFKVVAHDDVKIAMCQFIQIFVSYVSAKYYLNWFTVGKVTTKMNMVNFLWGTVYWLTDQ